MTELRTLAEKEGITDLNQAQVRWLTLNTRPVVALPDFLTRSCDKCGAEVGKWCLTGKGARSTKIHSIRLSS